MFEKQNIETPNPVHFVGRREYLDDLESLWRKATSSLVACRGRRRIGKSTLIREFARRTSSAYIEVDCQQRDVADSASAHGELNSGVCRAISQHAA